MHIKRRRLLSQLYQSLLPDEEIIWIGRNRSAVLTSKLVAATNKRILSAVPGPVVCEFEANEAGPVDVTVGEAILPALRPGERVLWTAKQRPRFAWIYLRALHVSVTDSRILFISRRLFSKEWNVGWVKIDMFRNWLSAPSAS